MTLSRTYYGGIGLVLALAAILALPLWLRNASHPLSGRTTVDICGMLADTLIVALPEPPARVDARIPDFSSAGNATCYAELPGSPGVAPGSRHVWLVVMTQRMLSTDGRAARTDRFVETWLAEVQASGSNIEPVTGPWRNAALIREPRQERRVDLLADDAGVVLWFSGEGIENQSLLAFAEAAAHRLRTK